LDAKKHQPALVMTSTGVSLRGASSRPGHFFSPKTGHGQSAMGPTSLGQQLDLWPSSKSDALDSRKAAMNLSTKLNTLW